MASHLVGYGFQEAFGFHICGRGEVHFFAHLCGETFGDAGPGVKFHVEDAGEEAVDYAEVFGVEARYGVVGQGEFVALVEDRLGCDWREGSGGDGARAVASPDGFFAVALVNDDGSGGEVSQALVLAVAEHGDDADEVDGRQQIDDAEKIAGHGFEESDLSARLLNDANLAKPFAGRLAVPEGLEESEVSPIHEEVKEDEAGDEPLFSITRKVACSGFRRGRCDEHEDENENGVGDDLQGGVGEDGEKAAADSGDREADGDLLGGVDSKLVWTWTWAWEIRA